MSETPEVQGSKFSVLRTQSYIPEACKKNGSASICAVIAGRSTKPHGFDNEMKTQKSELFIRVYYLQYLSFSSACLFSKLSNF